MARRAEDQAAQPAGAHLPPEGALQSTVGLLSAVANPTRLLVLLALNRLGPRTVGQLQTLSGIEQSALSHHLRVLRDARLVRSERRGRHVVYRLHDHHVAHIVEDAISHVIEATDD